MAQPLGILIRYEELTATEQELVQLAKKGADHSADFKLSFQSNFPVGAAILASNDRGESKIFFGSNVENDFMPATICAERVAAMTAVSEGYLQFDCVAVFCRKIPGGSPCGVCRQVLNQFGKKSALLNIVDHDSSVRKATVLELLPAANIAPKAFGDLSEEEKSMVRRLLNLKSRSHVPYSKRPRAALFVASDDKRRERIFRGVSDDNASFGASALAEAVAMRTARTEGYSRNVKLFVSVEDASGANPIDGECLQLLREFGSDSPVLLVAEDRSIVTSRLEELLPDSFGPESL